MDFPKSVPNIGLVNGRFVDENIGTGQVGSLIPSAWGNAVTDEILAVILSAGMAPAEGDTTQLKNAIFKLLAEKVPVALETRLGVVYIASQTQVNQGVDDTSAVTSKKLAAWFSNKWTQATEALAGLWRLPRKLRLTKVLMIPARLLQRSSPPGSIISFWVFKSSRPPMVT
ncbi:hypothetical protein M5C90_10875 [Pseudomonas chlororaphis subsp. piscium]|nr:hypothetical protein M5C90_10875 [Pseudomonas chlororaphis subsp. piscium]